MSLPNRVTQTALAEPKSYDRNVRYEEDFGSNGLQIQQDRAWLREQLLAGMNSPLCDPITPAYFERLQARARLLGLTVDTQVMDGQVLTFPDASFDLVVLHLIMAVIPEPMRCIREVARVLRPGGRVVVLDKFIPDEQRPPWLMRLLNPLTRFGGTEITRKLGPILAGIPLRIVHQEPAGFHGFMKIALLERTPHN